MPKKKNHTIPNGKCGLCGKSTYYKKTLCKDCEESYYNEKNRRPTTTLPYFIIKQRRIRQAN